MLLVEKLMRKIEENKFVKIAESLAAVYIYIYIVYCHLVNNFSFAFVRVANSKLNRVFKGRIMPFFRMLKNGMRLSFVALRDNICAGVSGFVFRFKNAIEYIVEELEEVVCVDRKMRAGPFMNGLNVLIYERGV